MAIAFSQREAQDTWAHVLERARAELPETTVVMWFADVDPVSLQDGVLALHVPSDMVRERLQHNHLDLIRSAALQAVGTDVEIRLDVDEALRGPVDDMIVSDPSTDPPGVSGRVLTSPDRSVIHRRRPDRARDGRPRAPVPQLHVRRVRPRAEQPVRARGGHGRRRSAAVEGIQPAVHLRRRRSGQDAPADRGRPSHVPAQAEPPREVRDVGAVRHRVHQGRSRAPGRQLPAEVPRGRRPARRRHPVPGQTRGDADRVLPHVQPPPHGRPADRDRVRSSSARDLRHGRASDQQVPMGALRRRAATRPRDAHRDPAAQGGTRDDRRPVRRGRVRGVQVRSERPRARGRARSGRRLVGAHRATDRHRARRTGAAGPDPADRARDPATA